MTKLWLLRDIFFIKYKGLLAHIKKYNDVTLFSLIWAKHNVLYYIGRNTSSKWTDTVKPMQRLQTVTVRIFLYLST